MRHVHAGVVSLLGVRRAPHLPQQLLVRDDLATLAGGLAVMLVWAGLVEAFLSQHHGPSIYNWKITFGLLELVTLAAFLAFSGRGRAAESTR